MPFLRQSLLLTAEFESISSLVPGSKVYYAGIEVGKVLNIYLNPDNNHIMVDFDVKSGIYLPQNTEAIAYVPNMLYSARLELRFQNEGIDEFLESGDQIPGFVGSYILDIAVQIDPYIKKLDTLVLALFPTKDSVRQVINSIEAGISQFYRGTSAFSTTLRSNEPNISNVLSTLEKISSDLVKREAEINISIQKLNKSTADFAKADYATKISAFKPDSIKIPDLSVYDKQIAAMTAGLEKINSAQDSSLSWLLHDKEFRDMVLNKADSIKFNIKDIREHPEKNISIRKAKNN
jgi:ABC-type transporter Mla subunit MlaD